VPSPGEPHILVVQIIALAFHSSTSSRETLTLLPTEKLNQKSVLEFVHNRYNKLILESPATPQAIRAWKTKWSLLVRDRRMFRHSKILAITVSVFVVTTGLGISYLDQLLPFGNQTSHIGSNGTSGNNDNHIPSSVTMIRFHTISRDILGGGDYGFTNLVINDNATWTSFWQRLDSNCYCSLMPTVNFTSRTVIAIILGEKPTAGYSIQIDNITQTGQTITVHSTIITPDPSPYCVVAQILTEPYHLVDIPKTTLNVAFVSQAIVHPCR